MARALRIIASTSERPAVGSGGPGASEAGVPGFRSIRSGGSEGSGHPERGVPRARPRASAGPRARASGAAPRARASGAGLGRGPRARPRGRGRGGYAGTRGEEGSGQTSARAIGGVRDRIADRREHRAGVRHPAESRSALSRGRPSAARRGRGGLGRPGRRRGDRGSSGGISRARLGLRRGLGGRGASRLLVEGLLQALDERGLQAVLLEAALRELLLQHGHGHPAGGLGRHGARGGSRRDLNARANDATID